VLHPNRASVPKEELKEKIAKTYKVGALHAHGLDGAPCGSVASESRGRQSVMVCFVDKHPLTTHCQVATKRRRVPPSLSPRGAVDEGVDGTVHAIGRCPFPKRGRRRLRADAWGCVPRACVVNGGDGMQGRCWAAGDG
jgi:hypothetical protein